MSAVRMVAYGVLEMKHKSVSQTWLDANADSATQARARAEDFERDQLRKLVNDELHRYGLLLMRKVEPKGVSWKTKNNTYVLYGQLEGDGFSRRPELCVGSFKECCATAAKLLDELDAAQIPDVKT